MKLNIKKILKSIRRAEYLELKGIGTSIVNNKKKYTRKSKHKRLFSILLVLLVLTSCATKKGQPFGNPSHHKYRKILIGN